MKRSFSSRFIDFAVLEPLLFLPTLAVVLQIPGVASPDFETDLVVGLLVGTAATAINLLGLWLFTYIRLVALPLSGGTKALWAIALFFAAPMSIPLFYWRYLRKDFLPGVAEQA